MALDWLKDMQRLEAGIRSRRATVSAPAQPFSMRNIGNGQPPMMGGSGETQMRNGTYTGNGAPTEPASVNKLVLHNGEYVIPAHMVEAMGGPESVDGIVQQLAMKKTENSGSAKGMFFGGNIERPEWMDDAKPPAATTATAPKTTAPAVTSGHELAVNEPGTNFGRTSTGVKWNPAGTVQAASPVQQAQPNMTRTSTGPVWNKPVADTPGTNFARTSTGPVWTGDAAPAASPVQRAQTNMTRTSTGPTWNRADAASMPTEMTKDGKTYVWDATKNGWTEKPAATTTATTTGSGTQNQYNQYALAGMAELDARMRGTSETQNRINDASRAALAGEQSQDTTASNQQIAQTVGRNAPGGAASALAAMNQWGQQGAKVELETGIAQEGVRQTQQATQDLVNFGQAGQNTMFNQGQTAFQNQIAGGDFDGAATTAAGMGFNFNPTALKDAQKSTSIARVMTNIIANTTTGTDNTSNWNDLATLNGINPNTPEGKTWIKQQQDGYAFAASPEGAATQGMSDSYLSSFFNYNSGDPADPLRGYTNPAVPGLTGRAAAVQMVGRTLNGASFINPTTGEWDVEALHDAFFPDSEDGEGGDGDGGGGTVTAPTSITVGGKSVNVSVDGESIVASDVTVPAGTKDFTTTDNGAHVVVGGQAIAMDDFIDNLGKFTTIPDSAGFTNPFNHPDSNGQVNVGGQWFTKGSNGIWADTGATGFNREDFASLAMGRAATVEGKTYVRVGSGNDAQSFIEATPIKATSIEVSDPAKGFFVSGGGSRTAKTTPLPAVGGYLSLANDVMVGDFPIPKGSYQVVEHKVGGYTLTCIKNLDTGALYATNKAIRAADGTSTINVTGFADDESTRNYKLVQNVINGTKTIDAAIAAFENASRK